MTSANDKYENAFQKNQNREKFVVHSVTEENPKVLNCKKNG